MGSSQPGKVPGRRVAPKKAIRYNSRSTHLSPRNSSVDISFERGDSQRPRGHALVYFRVRSEPDKVYATYIIVLPVTMDFTKYVPPFLASHLGNIPMGDMSAFSLPPVPEEMSSYEELLRLAEVRDDDLLNAGTMFSFDMPEMMQAMGEVVKSYAESWSEHMQPAISAPIEADESASTVNEVLYSLMSEKDRLAELSKLVGKLRFAMEGKDDSMGAEAKQETLVLSKYLPDHYYIPSLIQAVMDVSSRGAHLAQLYLDRCYKLSNGDYTGVRTVEEQINDMKASE